MAIEPTDLFVIQSQTDKKQYALSLDQLERHIKAGSPLIFRGLVDLNLSPAQQQPDPIVNPTNGDYYVVESEAVSIAPGWVFLNSTGSAEKNDQIIYDKGRGAWIILGATGAQGGTVLSVSGTTPITSNNDPYYPVIGIREARTETDAFNAGDNAGTAGAVAKLAEAADVVHTVGTGDPTAVVTADLLKITNEIVEDLVVSAGAVITVDTDDASGNGALTVSPKTGNVKVEINTSSTSQYGVVQMATSGDVTSGTAGPGAVIDASLLKNAIDSIPDKGIQSLTENGADIVSGALDINTDGNLDTTIGVNNKVFCPYDFSLLTDISEA